MKIDKVIEALGLSIQEKQEGVIETALGWYQGNVKDFHEYIDYQGTELKQTVTRASLGMAKQIGEKWANLIINPETIITVENEGVQKWIDETLKRLNFTNNMNTLVELYMSLGGGATVQYKDIRGLPQNDFINVEQIYPLEFSNDDVLSCAFISAKQIGGEEYAYVTVHKLQEDGRYLIRTFILQEQDNGQYEEVVLLDSEGNPIVINDIVSDVKQFQFYKPAIANNVNIGNPMGIPVFYNAIEELKAVDIAFDALINETIHGQITVYVSEEALKNEDGEMVYKPSQRSYYYLKSDTAVNNDLGEGSSNKPIPFVHVSAPSLRVDDLVNALNKALNLLGRKCGLGEEAFESRNGTIYTNTTQVISSNSDLYNTRQKHCSIVEHGLNDMIKSLYYIEFGKELTENITVQFDDSIIHDKEAETNMNVLMLNLGIFSKIQFLEKNFDMTREDAETHMTQFYEDEGITEDIELEEDEEI